MSVVECDGDDCDFATDQVSGLASHLYQSDAHPEVEEYGPALDRAREAFGEVSPPAAGEREPIGDDRGDGYTAEPDGGDDPADPPLPTPDDGDDGGDRRDDPEGCPECGCQDWFDPSPYGVSWQDVPGAGPDDDVRGCPACSDRSEWVLYHV